MKDSIQSNAGNEMKDFADRDLLFSRIVDRKADAADWQRFDQMEDLDADVAGEVVRFLRADALLGLSLDDELTKVAAVSCGFTNAPRVKPQSRAAAWTGWLAAAALALAFLGTHFAGPSTTTQAPTIPANDHVLALASPEEAMTPQSPVDKSKPKSSTRVIEELPLVLIGTRPSDDGAGFEVTVLRQVLESRRVDKLLGVARDEEGRPSPVPIDPAAITPPAVL